jgi:profilin
MFVYIYQITTTNMSWDSYIDNLVAQSKDSSGTAHCDRACIIGLDGGAPWTTAAHANAFKVSNMAQ